MKRDRRIFIYLVYMILGAVLLGLGYTKLVDAFWSGMGSALLAVGAIRSIQLFRIRNDESYREKVEIERSDERNRFISNKAWAWSGYLFVLIAAVSVIVFKLLGQEVLSMAASFAVCIVLVLYWISYSILKKKY